MIWLISLYRKCISPLKPPCCRFTPTCSAYALEAFKKRGFFVGLILTVGRICRCNPFFKGGYDPVPDHFTLRREYKVYALESRNPFRKKSSQSSAKR